MPNQYNIAIQLLWLKYHVFETLNHKYEHVSNTIKKTSIIKKIPDSNQATGVINVSV